MRKAATDSARRSGFTLIELLMVITILALLAALTVAGVGRVRSAQSSRTTEASVTKFQKALNQQLSAVFDDATGDKATDRGKTDRASILPFCDNDQDRAKALLCYVYTKLEFPTTFAEAKSGVNIGGVLFRPRAIYASVDGTVPVNVQPDDQAAALLYLNLQESGRRGTAVSLDDISGNATTTVTINGKSYTVLRDAWGIPITYRRWYQGDPDLQNLPYANLKPILGTVLADPYDRVGVDAKAKLRDWTNTTNRNLALAALGLSNFDGRNKVVTVESAGEDKVLDPITGPPTDDIYGHRLARFGNRGD